MRLLCGLLFASAYAARKGSKEQDLDLSWPSSWSESSLDQAPTDGLEQQMMPDSWPCEPLDLDVLSQLPTDYWQKEHMMTDSSSIESEISADGQYAEPDLPQELVVVSDVEEPSHTVLRVPHVDSSPCAVESPSAKLAASKHSVTFKPGTHRRCPVSGSEFVTFSTPEGDVKVELIPGYRFQESTREHGCNAPGAANGQEGPSKTSGAPRCLEKEPSNLKAAGKEATAPLASKCGGSLSRTQKATPRRKRDISSSEPFANPKVECGEGEGEAEEGNRPKQKKCKSMTATTPLSRSMPAGFASAARSVKSAVAPPEPVMPPRNPFVPTALQHIRVSNLEAIIQSGEVLSALVSGLSGTKATDTLSKRLTGVIQCARPLLLTQLANIEFSAVSFRGQLEKFYLILAPSDSVAPGADCELMLALERLLERLIFDHTISALGETEEGLVARLASWQGPYADILRGELGPVYLLTDDWQAIHGALLKAVLGRDQGPAQYNLLCQDLALMLLAVGKRAGLWELPIEEAIGVFKACFFAHV